MDMKSRDKNKREYVFMSFSKGKKFKRAYKSMSSSIRLYKIRVLQYKVYSSDEEKGKKPITRFA